MKILHVNAVSESGSTGRISQAIGSAASDRGHDVLSGYGRADFSGTNGVRIGNAIDVGMHGLASFFRDAHGLGSKSATLDFVGALDKWNPDAIGLHNIHGYFLNFPEFFKYLKSVQCPVVWTLHDCWPFTGHCAYFDRFDCTKWKTECFKCPMTRHYPTSLTDNSVRNYRIKKRTFNGLQNLVIVTPSRWMRNNVAQSFLSGYPVKVINNGVDLELFKPSGEIVSKKLVLGVANGWSERKGLSDFKRLRLRLPSSYRIVLIGLSKLQKRSLPEGIEGLERTENIAELVRWYQRTTVFVNPTYSDNFPTTHLEALACGVPVATYDVGGGPEAVDDQTGRVVRCGNVAQLADAIVDLTQRDRHVMKTLCRERAARLFNQNDRFSEYVDLYEALVAKSAGPLK